MGGLSLGLSLGLTSRTGGALTPPAGYVFLIDDDGAYLVDEDGAYLLEEI